MAEDGSGSKLRTSDSVSRIPVSRRSRDAVQVDVEDVELPEELVDDDADREMQDTRQYRRHALLLCSQVAADDRSGTRGRIGRTCREETSR